MDGRLGKWKILERVRRVDWVTNSAKLHTLRILRALERHLCTVGNDLKVVSRSGSDKSSRKSLTPALGLDWRKRSTVQGLLLRLPAFDFAVVFRVVGNAQLHMCQLRRRTFLGRHFDEALSVLRL